jgi:hypothetical protein
MLGATLGFADILSAAPPLRVGRGGADYRW